MMRPQLPIAAAVLLPLGLWAGCTSESEVPVTFVAGLRVLAARGEPAQVDPGAVSQVNVLVVDTEGRPVEVAWSRCLVPPHVGEAVNPDCVTDDANLEPLGAGESIAVTMPQVTAAQLGQPDATNGVYLPLVARVTAGDSAVLTVYRLRLGDGQPPNANPAIASVDVLDAAGVPSPLDPAAPRVVHAGDELILGATLEPGSAESYMGIGGAPKTETVTTSWFCTAGELSVQKTSESQPTTTLLLNENLPDPGKTIEIWAVAHDGRGGVGYTLRSLELQ